MTKADLVAVNSEFNLLPYKAEIADDWTPITTEGDCDSYATAKFARLVSMGWPLSALRLATCYVLDVPPPDNYHAVLLADLDGQTWVLDNRYPLPMPFDMLPYKFDTLQVAGTQFWEKAQSQQSA